MNEFTIIQDEIIELKALETKIKTLYSIYLIEPAIQIGRIIYRGYHYDSLMGDIGYIIDKKYRGNGYAQRALKLISQLLNENKIKDMWLTCNKNNIEALKQIMTYGEIIEKKFITDEILFFDCKTKKQFTKQKN